MKNVAICYIGSAESPQFTPTTLPLPSTLTMSERVLAMSRAKCSIMLKLEAEPKKPTRMENSQADSLATGQVGYTQSLHPHTFCSESVRSTHREKTLVSP